MLCIQLTVIVCLQAADIMSGLLEGRQPLYHPLLLGTLLFSIHHVLQFLHFLLACLLHTIFSSTYHPINTLSSRYPCIWWFFFLKLHSDFNKQTKIGGIIARKLTDAVSRITWFLMMSFVIISVHQRLYLLQKKISELMASLKLYAFIRMAIWVVLIMQSHICIWHSFSWKIHFFLPRSLNQCHHCHRFFVWFCRMY